MSVPRTRVFWIGLAALLVLTTQSAALKAPPPLGRLLETADAVLVGHLVPVSNEIVSYWQDDPKRPDIYEFVGAIVVDSTLWSSAAFQDTVFISWRVSTYTIAAEAEDWRSMRDVEALWVLFYDDQSGYLPWRAWPLSDRCELAFMSAKLPHQDFLQGPEHPAITAVRELVWRGTK